MTNMDISRKNYRDFYETVGKNYPEEEYVYHSLRGMLLRKFIEKWLSDKKGMLLDIGTGEGIYLRNYKGGVSVGADISIGKLLKARGRLPADQRECVFFAVADAEDLSALKANSFDVILCSEVIEHLPDARGVWSSIARLLKPEGFALVTCPAYRGSKPEWTELGILEKYGVPAMKNEMYFHTAYTPEELRRAAEKVGLFPLRFGTLEREVKPAVIAPVILLRTLERVSGFILNRKLKKSTGDMIIDRGSYYVFLGLKYTGLLYLILPLFRRGVRSYIIVRKPSSLIR